MKRYIYSQERGLKKVDDEEIQALMTQSTVVLAVLKPFLNGVPTSMKDIDELYCPSCGWMDPEEDTHMNDCPYAGEGLI